MNGYIYLFKVDGYYKVGMTKRSPYTRLKELNGSTAALHTFKFVSCKHVADVAKHEKRLHAKLKSMGLWYNKEYFIKGTQQVFNEYCNGIKSANQQMVDDYNAEMKRFIKSQKPVRIIDHAAKRKAKARRRYMKKHKEFFDGFTA